MYVKGVTKNHTASKMELLVTLVNSFQSLINVTMNYILDIAGSYICYCHNEPMNQTLKQ